MSCIYDHFLTRKTQFSLCSCFHAHPTTLLLIILGGPMHGRSPHLNFWGDRPPSPPRSPPLFLRYRGDFTQIIKTFFGISRLGNTIIMLWSQVEVCMNQKYRFKFLRWSGFEAQTLGL